MIRLTNLKFIITFFLTLSVIKTYGQVKPMHSSEVLLGLQKLRTLGSVLYIAAHPDDENTRLLAYLSNEMKFRTAYLSITRGDGGQNLLGSELGSLLGVIRTQELLAARKIDGAEQYFTRAKDFGYSKTPEETLEIWGKEKILSDVVWVIRNFRPEIIITRFPKTGEGGHGHHTASAILAEEAFFAAADPARFPEQLKYVEIWQTKRLLWNSFSTATALKIDVGAYNQLLGKSYTEIAADSRSMHKSQGFGVAQLRGSRFDYFSHQVGDVVTENIFEGINTTWSKIKNSQYVDRLFEEAISKYNPLNPSEIVPILVRAYQELKKMDNKTDGYWVKLKQKELEKMIVSACGIFYDATATDYIYSPGDIIKINLQALNRSNVPVKFNKIEYNFNGADSLLAMHLRYNEPINFSTILSIPANTVYSQFYWLKEKGEKGSFDIDDQTLIGKPENAHALEVSFELEIENEKFAFKIPVRYKWTDPVEGERYRNIDIVPEVSVNIVGHTFVFPDNNSKEIDVKLKANGKNKSGKVQLKIPVGWKTEPTAVSFDLKEKNEEQIIKFKVFPGKPEETVDLTAIVEINGKESNIGNEVIDYKYISPQAIMAEAQAKLVRVNVKTTAKNIGYVAGAGDEIPLILSQIGATVSLLSDQELASEVNLKKYDAIVIGIRAYNTKENLKHVNQKLNNYVQMGGTVVVQYNTSAGLVTSEIGPYPFKIARDRVSVENAPVSITNPKHLLLNYPNKIEKADFDGWVQERGLYFPNEWDNNYQTIVSTNDPGEKPLKGGILYAKYGTGNYIYTSYSWFRQLPEGVPGAIKIFANLISQKK